MEGLRLNNHNFLFISSFVLVLGIVYGATVAHEYYSIIDPLTSNATLSSKDSDIPLSFGGILYNNLKLILLLSFGGTLTFGGLTFLNLIFNGINIGMQSYKLITSTNLKIFIFIVFPHGIFEIPALITASAAGFKIPYEVLRFALGKKEEIITEEDAKEFFKLVGISIILIFIAAIIESTITLKIAGSLG